jgi:nitrogen permease regulator 2-like protein
MLTAHVGSRVLHQVPDGSITPSRFTRHRQPLFQYSSISEFIIPKQDFCDRLFTTCVSHYRIIGYPVCINDYSGKYGRNQFIFNFALVIDEDLDDWGSYASVVRKLGRLLRALEEQGGFLSKEEDPSWFEDNEDESGTIGKLDVSRQDKLSHPKDDESDNDGQPHPVRKTVPVASRTGAPRGSSSKVYALCEMILEDLNNYYECMIPIGEHAAVILSFDRRF